MSVNRKSTWTDEQRKFVNENAGKMSVTDIAKYLNKNYDHVQSYIKRHKFPAFVKPIKEKYNRLTFLSKIENNSGDTYANFLCDCGKTVTLHLSAVKTGNTKSCGCLLSRQDVGLVSRAYYNRIKDKAELRSKTFNVSIEYLDEIMQQQNGLCALTKIPIVVSSGFIDGKWKVRKYSGSLDRKNSDIGYEENNLQWLHKDVNLIKFIYSNDNFIEVCKLITNEKKDEEKLVYNEYFEDIFRLIINTAKTNKKGKNFVKRIPFETLINLYHDQGGRCALSGQILVHTVNNLNRISLDRINSNKPYEEGNLQLVTKQVNNMKWNYPQSYFLEICKLVAENN